MANQQNSLVRSDGSGTGSRDFSYTFPTFKESEVKVEIDNVVKTLTTHYTIVNHNNSSGGTVRFNTTGLPDGTASSTPIRIFRQTDVDTSKAEFTAGSALKAQEINDNFKQVRHALQEAIGAAATDRKIQRFNIEADSIDGTLIADDVINSEHYVAGSIDHEHLANDIIDGDNIQDSVINSEHYVDGSIDREHLAADIVDGTKIADNSIDSEHYVDGSIDTAHIGNVQVTTGKIADDAVTSDKIATNTIATGNIANNAITRGKILDGEVVRSKIEADAIDGTKLADNAVNSEHYTDGSIDRVHLSADIIDSTKLADNAVNSEHYVDGSIGNVHIANSTITSQKIVDATLDTATLANDAVTEPKIINGAVTTNKIAADAVNGTKIADDSIDSEHYVDGSIDNQHIANSTITSAKIVDETLDTATLANSAVTEPKIATGAVTTTKIADNAVTAAKIADAVIVTNSEQASHSVNDTTFFTTAAAEARYFNASTSETIKNGDTFPDNDTTIATTAAINDRIIDLVDDVGGFVPIANETSFPTANPDVNNGAGTLVSIKAIGSTRTPSGGTVTIANGSGSNTVTITGCGSTALTAGFGVIVETTTTLHTYAFHRLVPKATEVTTVATNITNVVNAGSNTTNINTVAGQISPTNNISTVAGIATAVSTVATNNSNVTSVANNMANVNNFNDRYQIASNNPSTDGGGNALAAGDLYFNTSANELKVYTGSAWQGGVTATGNFAVVTGNTFTGDNTYNDGVQALFGTGSDLRIYHHTDSNSYIQNYTGDLFIKSNNDDLILQAADDILIRPQNGEDGIRLTGNGSVDLYYDASKKLETTSAGVSITGSLYTSSDIFINGAADASSILRFYDGGADSWILTQDNSTNVLSFRRNSANRLSLAANGDTQIPLDNQKLLIGASQDLEIYHNGTNTVIDNNTGDLYIETTGSGDDIFIQSKDDITIKTANGQNAITAAGGAQIDLYHDNAKKFETTSTGAKFTSSRVQFHNSTSSGSYAQYSNSGTGHGSTAGFWVGTNSSSQGVVQNKQNTDILFYTNDTEVARLTADGAFKLPDNGAIRLGGSGSDLGDLRIYHDGSNSYIKDAGAGDLLIKHGSETGAIFRTNAEVELFYDNAVKLETTTNGVAVTGFTDSRRDNTSTYSSTSAPPNTVARFYNQSATTDSSASVQLRSRNANHADDLWYMTSVSQSQNYNGFLSFSTRTGASTYQETFRLLNNGFVDIPQDNAQLRFGAGQDLSIFHNGTNSFISNTTGILQIDSDDRVQVNATELRVKNAGDTETLAKFIENGAVELYHNNIKQLETSSGGIIVTDDDTTTTVRLNTSSGTAGYLYASGTTDFGLLDNSQHWLVKGVKDGKVELRYDNSAKFETYTYGVKVSGTAKIESGGNFHAFDNVKFLAGTGEDLQIYHSGTNSYLRNSTGIMHVGGSGGNLLLEALGDVRTVSWEGESMIEAKRNGAVELYYDNSKKLETRSGGVTISGGTNGLTVNHTGGDAIDCVRGGKTLAFNANFGAANTHSAINISSGMELRFQVNAADKIKMSSAGDWVPTSNNARSLGTSSLRWSDVYTNDLHLSNKGSSNEMDGTWGDWTMQEGESDLFLKNNRSGKKYKFNLTEVS